MGNISWGYSLTQWRNSEVDLVRIEQMESAFKVISVCGFNAIEITDATLGGESVPGSGGMINGYFGSPAKFLDFLAQCGVGAVCSHFVSGFDFHHASDAATHTRIAAAAARAIDLLAALGGNCLVVRPMDAYWQEAPITDDKIKTVGALWSKIGAMAKAAGLKTAMRPDFLCGVRREEHIEKLLAWTDPDTTGIALGTADFAIAGIDPVAFYNRHATRVNHVYFNDAVTADTQDEYADENAEMIYWPRAIVTAGRKRGIERWYYEMGTPGGLVDFPALLAAMERHDYDGWVVVDSDHSPHAEESVMLNGWHKRRLSGALR